MKNTQLVLQLKPMSEYLKRNAQDHYRGRKMILKPLINNLIKTAEFLLTSIQADLAI